jgi:perosamine synthetase
LNNSLHVRPALPRDADRLFAWRNEPWVVSQGASQRTVTRAEHDAWFARTLEQSVRELFLVEIDGEPVGMVRYDFTGAAEAAISLYLLPPHPGHGHGTKVVQATAPQILLERRIARLVARVRDDNAASLRFFGKLGFRDIGGEGELRVLTFERGVVPHSRPWVGEAEARAAAEVITSLQLAQGPKVAEFERRWAEQTYTNASAAVGSGVAALRLALLALGVGAGDEVLVRAYRCVAWFKAVLALGATPILADVVPGTWNLCPDDARRRRTPRTRAVVAVHLFGSPAPMRELTELGLPVVEDCAHGIGGHCEAVPFGAAGAVSIGSFYATKMLAAGEGGIVAARDAALIERVRQARDYGDQPADGRHLNDKMTDIEAAIAQVQLNRLPDILAHRSRLACRYDAMLQPLSDEGLVTLPPATSGRIWYRYALELQRHTAANVVMRMANFGVKAEQPVWDLRHTSLWSSGLTNSERAFDRVLSLPLYPALTPMEQGLAVAALEGSLHATP